jgi:hypothetical protein
MLLGKAQPIENLIVYHLSRTRALSALSLFEMINKDYRRASIQGVYKELRKLIIDGVVWKHGPDYSLSAAWILNLSELTDQMYHTLNESGLIEDVLPGEGKKVLFRFSSLPRLDDFWINSLIMMIKESAGKRMYQWLPHPWFNLYHNYKSLPFQNALRIAGGFVQSIIGGDSFLDKRAQRLTTKGVYEFSYAPGPFDEERGTYYSVTDSYLQTVRLDAAKVSAIEGVYNSCGSEKEFDGPGVMRMLEIPCKISLTIDTDKRKVRRIYNKLRRHFEI